MTKKAAAASGTKKRSQAQEVWLRLKKNKQAMVGLAVFCLIVLICFSAPLYMDYDARVIQQNISEKLQAPSAEHLLGTDNYGRDTLARLIFGGRISITIGIVTALSALAVLQGFLDFCPDHPVQGVLLNQCSEGAYPALAAAIRERFGGRVRPLGFLPVLPECALSSRHLGLVTAAEVSDLREKLARLARQAERSIDLDGLLELARSAPPLEYEPVRLPRFDRPVRIAVARDRAFCFYYEDSLAALTELGAELVPFSPLADPALPEEIHGLYLGGGYPELYAPALSENASLRAAIRAAVEGGLPCIAECGGFMYLTQAIAGAPMAGVLPGTCADAGRLVRFGYVTLRARRDNLLCRAGEEIRGHEFHRWDATERGEDFTAVKPTGRSWTCAVATPTLYAGYPHFHFYANPAFAPRFYEACLKEKERHDRVR